MGATLERMLQCSLMSIGIISTSWKIFVSFQPIFNSVSSEQIFVINLVRVWYLDDRIIFIDGFSSKKIFIEFFNDSIFGNLFIEIPRYDLFYWSAKVLDEKWAIFLSNFPIKIKNSTLQFFKCTSPQFQQNFRSSHPWLFISFGGKLECFGPHKILKSQGWLDRKICWNCGEVHLESPW
jgi:hypothetical protein